ncbi:Hypothetical predicted protein [Mytilus galloprovincialis]|uniref:Uncharacterized protein n=1 Tax=Mytilus galloprovincialis TaxID=29158 RepID=A0A8B6FNK8_MYTGA|nr:Hypothetical predicted protein [Mytilus galloprovincialis]
MEKRIKLLVVCFFVIITLFEAKGNGVAPDVKDKLQPCNSSRECGYRRCCVIENLKGRKKRSISFAGVCRPYGQIDSVCVVENQYANANVFRGWCPCKTPLTCIGSGITEVPYGEKGTCG